MPTRAVCPSTRLLPVPLSSARIRASNTLLGTARYTTTSIINPNSTDTDDSVCFIGERYKYHSWPTEEHAAFAFARLASPGHTSIGPCEFVSALKRMQLNFNLGDRELERVFDSLDTNGDGRLSLEEFKIGRTSHPFTKALVEALSGSGTLSSEQCDKGTTFPTPNFDWRLSTAENYRAPLDDGFVGENVAIRKSLDYSYHNNYTPCRQHYQDALIKNNVLLDGSGSDQPWLVLTCGKMGSGKGWVLGWMSANGILPLERVSKIDPDAFKLRMAEWPIYQQQSVEVAGTQTHAESSYIAEIAQHLAMNNGMDVWVDGSLRQWRWYQQELQRVRGRYPQYRIAIVAIDAPEHKIEGNIQKRARETGRHVPRERRQESAQGIERGLRELTHLVDMIAHVQNEGTDSSDSAMQGHEDVVWGEEERIDEPILKSVSMIDRSGNWDLIRELTSST